MSLPIPCRTHGNEASIEASTEATRDVVTDGASRSSDGVVHLLSHSHDDAPFDTLSSPASSPLTTSPDSTPFLSLADLSFTPLSILDDSCASDGSAGGVGGGSGRRCHSGSKPTATPTATATATTTAPMPHPLGIMTLGVRDMEALCTPISPSTSTSRERVQRGDITKSKPCADGLEQHQQSQACLGARSNSRSDPHDAFAFRGQVPVSEVSYRCSATAFASASLEHGHGLGLHLGRTNSVSVHETTLTTSPLSGSSSYAPPLQSLPSAGDPLSFQSGSIHSLLPKTQLASPQPKPIIRTVTDCDALAIKHPTPDLNTRSGAYAGNIAQLEATAERLSLTSSIDDAIRDLHGELKRSDSRRSSLLAANLKAPSSTDDNSSAVCQLKRHLSTSSSIVSTNIAARHGGYSPAAFVKSPTDSLTSRLRSNSKNSAGRPDLDLESILSRHGPGKASTRSVRSSKMTLAEISESAPIALTQDVLDKADSVPRPRSRDDELFLPTELRDANIPSTDVFHNMMGDDSFMNHSHVSSASPNASEQLLPETHHRPGSSGSINTFQQSQDAFADFDGVHWEPVPGDDPDGYAPPEPKPKPRMPTSRTRPQSYMDPESGQQMLYYPARVPAMLNLPPKLSNKPKASDRQNRRSQVLSAMMDKQQSRLDKPEVQDNTRDSWLPDPLAGQRNSFAALSSDELNMDLGLRAVPDAIPDEPVPQVEEPEAETLRRPQRLSRMDPENRKSRMLRGDLPPQLRASAYFDIPASTAPEIEVKDGSAMRTLDSILDASANAPVTAFTDHNFAGKLGHEIYGKEKKRASMAPSTLLRPTSKEKEPKKRSSFMWLGKRSSHEKDRHSQSDHGLGPVNADTHAAETQGLAHSDDDEDIMRPDEHELDEAEHEGSDENDGFQGPPTTLLAELQLRKQQQKERTQRQYPDGMHATLLEMDAVLANQQEKRKDKRVNLAWEDENVHLERNESDDEDVPLAILAARNQGAQNVMDLQRPMGLMERREIEDNEPLSHRRARLHGEDPLALMVKRPSMMNLSSYGQPLPSPNSRSDMHDPEEEGETLAERKRRLAAKDEAENPLPKARPVSSHFSAELLSQFGDLDKKEDDKENKAPEVVEEETLGQRRRRLQAEREAREREMNFNAAPRTMNMASVLSAHPRKDMDIRAQADRQRLAEASRAKQDRDAKMAAIRNQMPTTLIPPNLTRSGGFHSGVFNDGTGGAGPLAARSSPALNTQVFNPDPRASTVFSTYGAAVQHPAYASVGNLNAPPPYPGVNPNPYGGVAMGVYGGGGLQVPVNGGSMDRVEQWRQGVRPL
ncbi:hypothetical protein G7046_g1017 [Stylonectria norvegica]|nr:hypothetical protein G7046_g1017 [Stylonectria norvegica]